MMTDPNNSNELSSAPQKKAYSAMKVSKLGSLSELTQGFMFMGYADAQFGFMFMTNPS